MYGWWSDKATNAYARSSINGGTLSYSKYLQEMDPVKPRPKVIKVILLVVLMLAIGLLLIDRMMGPSM